MFEIILKDCIAATIGVISLASVGIYLTKIDILNKKNNKVISKMIEQLLTPALIISSFIESLELDDVNSWLPCVMTSLVSIFVGLFLGYIANIFILKDEKYKQLILLASSVAMTTNVQLNVSHNLRDYLEALTEKYVQNYDIPHQNTLANGETRAITYIMIYTFVNTIVRWTIGKSILESMHKQKSDQNSEEIQPKKSIFVKIKQYLNPPLVAALFAVFLLILSPKSFIDNLLQKGTFLNRSVYNALYVVGRSQPPLVLLTLGSNLFILFKSNKEDERQSNDEENNKQEKHISNKTVLGICIVKLIFVPIFGGLILFIMVKMQIVSDPVLMFVAVLSFATPTAINLIIIGQLYAPEMSVDISKILLLGYGSFIITLPIIMIIFFNIIM